jgi:MFS family permease
MAAPALSPPVRRLLLSHALAALGMSLPWPLLLVLVWDRVGGTTHGDLALGLAGAARMLPYVLLSWATGMLADRFRRDRLLHATLGARMLLLTVSAVAVAGGSLLVAVLAAALAVACGTPAYPALAAAMPAVAGESRRRATDLLVTIEVASFVVGPAVGGLLLAEGTRGWLPVLAVGVTALAAVPLRGIRLPRPSREPAGSRRTTAGPLAALRSSRAATRAVGVAALVNAVGAALVLALIPLATVSWKGGAAGYGMAAAMFGLGALAAPLLWRLGSTSTTRSRLGLVLLGGALAVVPLAPAVGWAVVPLLVAGAAAVHVEGAVTEAIQDAVPDDQRAGILGLTDSVMVSAALLSSLVAPSLASAVGARPMVIVLAAACVAVAMVPAVSRPAASLGRRARPTEPSRPRARSSSAAAPRG